MVTLKQYNGSTVQPTDDAVLYNALLAESGVVQGANCTIIGASQIQISSGRIMVCGRMVTVDNELVDANISPSGSQPGRLILRVDMANTWGADYFISIHTNANTNPAVNGTECYVYSQNNPAFYLAEDIVSQIVRRVGTKDNGVYVRPSLYVLRRTQMPSVLVELAYLTNYEDFVLLTTMQYQFAYGIYNGILNFLGLPFL